jgi:hypothetical protein
VSRDTDQSPPPSPTRGLLEQLLRDALAEARDSARDILEELAKPEPEPEIVHGHMLDLHVALGERQGLRNALHDLDEAGLL